MWVATVNIVCPKLSFVIFVFKLNLFSFKLRRSVGVEKVPAGGRVSSLNPDHLKPMRKRKRKEYLSPSEEDSDIEGTVGQNVFSDVPDVIMSYH